MTTTLTPAETMELIQHDSRDWTLIDAGGSYVVLPGPDLCVIQGIVRPERRFHSEGIPYRGKYCVPFPGVDVPHTQFVVDTEARTIRAVPTTPPQRHSSAERLVSGDWFGD